MVHYSPWCLCLPLVQWVWQRLCGDAHLKHELADSNRSGLRCVVIAAAHSLGVARLRGQGRDLAGKGARGLGVTPASPGGRATRGEVLSQSRAAQVLVHWAGCGCTGTREGWEGRMQMPAGNGDRGLFGTLAGATWRRGAARAGRREQEVTRPGRKHSPFPNFNPNDVALILRLRERSPRCGRSPLTRGHLSSESRRPSRAFQGAEKKTKPPPPFPDEPTRWSKARQLPGMPREGSPPLHSQNCTLLTPSPVQCPPPVFFPAPGVP